MMHTRSPKVFIVYQGFEEKLADQLWKLYEDWGFSAFHCRRNDMTGKDFREVLRKEIRSADLVVILISREFQWSGYCHAEAGIAIAFDKPIIPVLVPPVSTDEFHEVCPVLDQVQIKRADSQGFVSELWNSSVSLLKECYKMTDALSSELFKSTEVPLKDLKPAPDLVIQRHARDIRDAVDRIGDRYALKQPHRKTVSTWDNLKDDGAKSIVGNIVSSIRSQSDSTELVCIGVSLKFSLGLITKALQEIAESSISLQVPKKRLRIKLIHMDDQSHILQAMKVQDAAIIRTQLESGWQKTHEEWRLLCEKAGIDLIKPSRTRIDYLPPRVGILIDNTLLYAGRCAFEQRGSTDTFNLRVGELEYAFYDLTSKNNKLYDMSKVAISEFREFITAFEAPKNNFGLAAVFESDEWRSRLEAYIRSPSNPIKEITMISKSGTFFEPLLNKIIDRCPDVTLNIFVHDPDGTKVNQDKVRSKILNRKNGLPTNTTVKSFSKPPTMRAIMIDNVLIGVQPYAKFSDTHVDAESMPLCMIITRCLEEGNFMRVKEAIQKSVQ